MRSCRRNCDDKRREDVFRVLPLHHPAHKVERRTRIRTEISTSIRCSPHRAFVAAEAAGIEPARWSFGGSAVTMTVTPMERRQGSIERVFPKGMYSRSGHSSQSLCTDSNRDLASNGLPQTWGQAKCSDKSAGDFEALLLRGLTRFPRSGRIRPCKASGLKPLRNVVPDPRHSLLNRGGFPPPLIVTPR